MFTLSPVLIAVKFGCPRTSTSPTVSGGVVLCNDEGLLGLACHQYTYKLAYTGKAF